MGRASNIIAELLAPEVEEGLVWVGGGGWSLEGAVWRGLTSLPEMSPSVCFPYLAARGLFCQ